MGDKNSILDTIGEWAEKFTGSESQGEGQGQAQDQGGTPNSLTPSPSPSGEGSGMQKLTTPLSPGRGVGGEAAEGAAANGGQPKKTGDSGKKGKTGDTGKTDKDGKDETENKKEDTIDKVNNTVHEVSETINAFSNLIDAVKKQDATLTLKEVCAPTKLGEEAFHQLESLDMSKLIGAPINAAIDAHYNAAKKALECINEMGVKDGTLAVVTFNFFRNGKMAKMSIPLLTLVPIATMRIKEMTYDFKVKINTDSSINLVTGNENVFSYGVGLNNGKSEQANHSTPLSPGRGVGGEAAKAGEGENKGKETEAKGKEGEANHSTPLSPGRGVGGEAAEGAANHSTPLSPGRGVGGEAAAATAVKNAARVEPTFGVSFSSKKDSKATQNSKYSVETSMDIKLTVVSDENIPAGVSRMLEILNNAVEVYNPNGELSVSSNMVKIANDYAVVSVVYMDGDGCLALDKITCKCITNGDVKPSLLNGGDKVQILFDTPGTYIISAGALQSPVIVEGESK